MKRIFAASVIAAALPLASSGAVAQERAGNAALGALSGAVVLGPVGLVAGAVVGYTAGPSIARAWGLKRDERPARPVKPSMQGAGKPQGAVKPSTQDPKEESPTPRAQPSGPSARAGDAWPPVQSLE